MEVSINNVLSLQGLAHGGQRLQLPFSHTLQ